MENKEIIWKEVFLEVALRAMHKVHLTHSPWALNKFNIKSGDISLLNNNKAILLALETTVASEISNEFIYSMYSSGLEINEESRHYEILRELRFNNTKEPIFYETNQTNPTKKSKQVDLYIRRWSNEKDKTHLPVFIELKRYCLYDFQIATGKVKKRRGNNKDAIKNDIKNLRTLRENLALLTCKELHEFKNCLIYQLVWGESKGPGTNWKKELSKNLEIAEKNIWLRWLPLEINSLKMRIPKVKNWLWLALLEIDPP